MQNIKIKCPSAPFFLVLQQLDVCVLIPDSGAEWTDFFFCFIFLVNLLSVKSQYSCSIY